jgi:putative transposase
MRAASNRPNTCPHPTKFVSATQNHPCIQGAVHTCPSISPNHVHLILVPPDQGALAAALSRLHRDYARRINFREKWRSYLWQGRYASFAMDEDYLLACARYVELNPVRARLVAHPADWSWSSVAAHLTGAADPLVQRGPWMARAGNWAAHLGVDLPEESEAIRLSTSTGRPLGSQEFVARLERTLGRTLGRRKPGRKPKEAMLNQSELF